MSAQGEEEKAELDAAWRAWKACHKGSAAGRQTDDSEVVEVTNYSLAGFLEPVSPFVFLLSTVLCFHLLWFEVFAGLTL